MKKMDKEFSKLVGDLIKGARIKNGLIQEQVANMLGITRPQICNIESGNYCTTPENIFKLSIIFNCSVADLFPSREQYKPKLTIPPPRKIKKERKVRGPNTSKPAYLLQKENELLKKQLEQLTKPTTNDNKL